jgi:glycosyltransferase involved in cell wall biosynthesis
MKYKNNEYPTIVITANILGAILNFWTELLKFLISKGYTVYCIGNNDKIFPVSSDQLEILGVKVINVKQNRTGINPFQDFLYLIRLWGIYRKLRPLVVLHFFSKPTIYGSLACGLLGIRSFSIIVGLGSGFLQSNLISKIQFLLYRFALRYNKFIFFYNNSDQELFLNKKIAKADQSRMIPGDGINTEYFCLPSLDITRPLRFIYIGRLIKDKGIREFIESARRVISTRSDAKFYVAGHLDVENPSAISFSYLENSVEDGIIEFLGPLDDVREAFKKMHVVVLPSYREGLSTILLEAASCNRPIITTDAPGCRELVFENKNGILCSAKSTESLYEAIIKMLEHTNDQIKTMGEAGRFIVLKHFSADLVSQIYFNAIKELGNDKSGLLPEN